jgi:hypothetical protein
LKSNLQIKIESRANNSKRCIVLFLCKEGGEERRKTVREGKGLRKRKESNF